MQYTAAALVSENKSLCFPASADSVPTSKGQEDHVSMGSISGRKTLQIIQNLEKILGIELFCAAQGLDFRRPLKSTPIIEALHSAFRKIVPFADADRYFSSDMEASIQFLREGQILSIIEAYKNKQ